MENLFLNIVECLSESRVWLLPLLLICEAVVLLVVILRTFTGVQEEMDF